MAMLNNQRVSPVENSVQTSPPATCPNGLHSCNSSLSPRDKKLARESTFNVFLAADWGHVMLVMLVMSKLGKNRKNKPWS